MIPIKDNIQTDRFPLMTLVLILANLVVYVLSVRHGGSLLGGPDAGTLLKYGAIPFSLTHSGAHCAHFAQQTGIGPRAAGVFCNGQTFPGSGGRLAHVGAADGPATWETVFTAMFMHGSIIHIGGNMLFLWIFGNTVEDALGRLKFLALYLVGGVAALALGVLVDASSTAPTIGAAGAIAAVLGGYIVLYTRARVLTLVFVVLLFTVIELPALVMLGIWFGEQALFGAANLTNPTGGGGAVAYFGHVGGLVFGALAIRALATRRRPVPATRQV